MGWSGSPGQGNFNGIPRIWEWISGRDFLQAPLRLGSWSPARHSRRIRHLQNSSQPFILHGVGTASWGCFQGTQAIKQRHGMGLWRRKILIYTQKAFKQQQSYPVTLPGGGHTKSYQDVFGGWMRLLFAPTRLPGPELPANRLIILPKIFRRN